MELQPFAVALHAFTLHLDATLESRLYATVILAQDATEAETIGREWIGTMHSGAQHVELQIRPIPFMLSTPLDPGATYQVIVQRIPQAETVVLGGEEQTLDKP